MMKTKVQKHGAIYTVALIVMLVYVFGCHEAPDNEQAKSIQENKPNPDLLKVAPDLYFMIIMGQSHESASCELSQAMAQTAKRKVNTETANQAHEWSENFKIDCSIWKDLNKYNQVVADIVLKEHPVKVEGFLFYAHSGEGDELSQFAVGLFKNLEGCKKVEKLYLKRDYFTKPCRKWNPKEAL